MDCCRWCWWCSVNRSERFAYSHMVLISCSTAHLRTLTIVLYYRYIVVPLILILRIVDAVTCPMESSQTGSSSGGSISNSANKPMTLTKRKVCPDFKDNEDEKYCCPSHVVPGSYYCCSQEHLYKIEAEQAAEIRRQFIKKLVEVCVRFYIKFAYSVFSSKFS